MLGAMAKLRDEFVVNGLEPIVVAMEQTLAAEELKNYYQMLMVGFLVTTLLLKRFWRLVSRAATGCCEMGNWRR